MTKLKPKTKSVRFDFSTWRKRGLDFLHETGARNLWFAFGLLAFGLTLTVVLAL